jgi:hypothetical protein
MLGLTSRSMNARTVATSISSSSFTCDHLTDVRRWRFDPN